jgi:hypothetical protein
MPFTPFHYPLAYGLHRLFPKWSLPGFIIGAMVPDLEIPIIVILFGGDMLPGNRLVLHSLFGAATLGTGLSLLLVAVVVPRLIRIIIPSWYPLIDGSCKVSRSLVLACCLGAISHVLLDVANHSYNPVWWPFSSTLLRNPYNCALGTTLGLGVHLVLGVCGIGILIHHRHRLPDAFLGDPS